MQSIFYCRGSDANNRGGFQVYEMQAAYTKANFLQDPSVKTLFVRFSTVVGSRGSGDLARDV